MERRQSERDKPPPSIYNLLDTPERLRADLTRRGALEFTPYASGLFPASSLAPEMSRATGMGMAWFRDNAHVAIALHESGCYDLASRAGRAMLNVLHNNTDILQSEPSSEMSRLPVRVHGDTLENDTEARIQNDSVGYLLWSVSRQIKAGTIEPRDEDLDRLVETVKYLDKIEYWHDADEGHWEEDRRVHASSIGVVLAGLNESREMLDILQYSHDIDFDQLMEKGSESFYSILTQGRTDTSIRGAVAEQHYPPTIQPDQAVHDFFSEFSVHDRKYDSALLFLVEPLNILRGEWAEKIVSDIEQQLHRDRGIARYIGDTYWEPRFPDIMAIGERTTQAEGSTERRNRTAEGVGYTCTEAQWTLFDPLLSAHWGKRYLITGELEAREKQLYYLERSLSQLATTKKGLQLPEAYYYDYIDGRGNVWVENDHTPLLWSQANLLRALRVFEAT